ncbi:MAG TPA: hypothetical protein VK590_09475 [Saprospiraceae bacterium]|nr:hypothetical protein [Saprospiraceae bacterium]
MKDQEKKEEKRLKVLWVDDELTEKYFAALKKYFEIILVNNAKAGIKAIKNIGNFYGIVTDLKMKPNDGIWFMDHLDIISRKKALVCSAYSKLEPYKNLLEDRGITQERQIELESVVDYDEEVLKVNVIDKIKKQTDLAKDYVFNMASEEFYNLDLREKKELNDYIYSVYKDIIDLKFFQTKATWLIFAKGEIINFGYDYPPDSLEVLQLSKKLNSPIFRFFSGDISEEIANSNSGISWHYYEIDSNNPGHYKGFYPSIEVFIDNDSEEKVLLGDFDTGTISTFVDFNFIISLLKKKELNELKYAYNPGPSMINGRKIYYDIIILPVYLNAIDVNGNNKSICIEMAFKGVEDWNNSWFTSTYKTRKALFGRDLLEVHKLALVLDGKNNKTFIKCEE